MEATEIMLEPQAIIEQLRALARQIPEFGHLPQTRKRALSSASGADPAFVQSAIAAVGKSQIVQEAVGRSADALRAEVETADRWSAVEAEARSLLQGIAAANLARRHRVGLAALQAYSISRQLVRQDTHSELLPHVTDMKRLNRFGHRRVRKPAPAPAPQPAPQSVL